MFAGSRAKSLLDRRDDRVVIHFDYDCFYAAVFEAENPALKSLPLAVQQKQIIVTCNYEARRRGLYKLQLITEAKKVCPDVIIVLGEDLTRFRNASKSLYNLLRGYTWNDRVERLGFDEVWMDVTDIVDYNYEFVNRNHLENSYFHLSKSDPLSGFHFDASAFAGHVYDEAAAASSQDRASEGLAMRLLLASHYALYLRQMLEYERGYTATVGISTSKLLSKLIGNVHKPQAQTTLLPPYKVDENSAVVMSNVTAFVDAHDIGAVPGIGFKLAQKLREFVLGRSAAFNKGLVYGKTMEKVTVGQVRQLPGLTPDLLDKVLGGPGAPQGIGAKVFALVHGVDDTVVSPARNVPHQISIEDSYIRLDTLEQVQRELLHLSSRLIERMRFDLTESDEHRQNIKWIGYPTSLRLTTRPRPPVGPDGTRVRSFKRITRSGPVPMFIYSTTATISSLATRLVSESLLPLFRRLHPEKQGWNLSLVNVAVADITDEKAISAGKGKDIGAMFKQFHEPTSNSKNTGLEITDPMIDIDATESPRKQEERFKCLTNESQSESTPGAESTDLELSEDTRSSASPTPDLDYTCTECGLSLPVFAQTAHSLFHSSKD